MPSTSGLVAQYPRKEDKLIFFQELKKLRDEEKNKKNKIKEESVETERGKVETQP